MRALLLAALLGGLFAVDSDARSPAPGAGEGGGNVMILLADDLGVDAVSAYGEGPSPPPSPNLDKLAQEGVLFRNVWSNPVCSPTRATILTGRYSFRTGLGWTVDAHPPLTDERSLSLTETTLPELLTQWSSVPYSCAAFGKWHLGKTVEAGGTLAPQQAGFSHFAGSMESVGDYYHWMRVENGAASVSHRYATTDTVDSALDWLETAQEPWLCYVAFHSPHVPLHKPPNDLHTVDFTGVDPNPSKEPLPYWRAMVEAMDTEIGRLINGIPAGAREKTTIIFVGDNGTSPHVTEPPFLQEHAKGTLFEGGINVPLIVSSPLVKNPGAECDALVNTTDVFATVATVAELELKKIVKSTKVELDSVSLVRYLKKPGRPSKRDFVLSEIFHHNIAGHSWPPACVPLGAECYCELDLGFGGPGNVKLSICGKSLQLYNLPELKLENAEPFSFGVLLASTTSGSTFGLGGTLIPSAPHLISPIVADATGTFAEKLAGGLADAMVFYQAVMVDGEQPDGFAFSNAVQAQMIGGSVKAVRDKRYKLVIDFRTCEELFYDLKKDPFELNPIEPVKKNAKAAYKKMRKHLADLLE